MKYQQTINVNDLNEILQKYFKSRDTFITSIEFGDCRNQWNPKKAIIGLGGTLNITFDLSRKVKGATIPTELA